MDQTEFYPPLISIRCTDGKHRLATLKELQLMIFLHAKDFSAGELRAMRASINSELRKKEVVENSKG